MKRTVTLRWRTLGFAGAIGLGFLLAITPDNFARGAKAPAVPMDMPADGFVVEPATLAAWLDGGTSLSLVDVREAVHLSAAEIVSADSLEKLHADPVIVIARNDVAAGYVVALLRLAGRDAWALRGGLADGEGEASLPADPAALAPTIPPPPPAPHPGPIAPRSGKAKRGKGC